MTRFLLILGAALAFSVSAQAGNIEGQQEQRALPPIEVNVTPVVNNSGSNTPAYLGVFATLAVGVLGYLGVRHQRKK